MYHGSCNGMIERHHGAGRNAFQQLVQREDLRPVRILGPRRFVMNCRNGRLQLIQAHRSFRQLGGQKFTSFGDCGTVPESTILFVHRDQLLVRSDPRRPARVR